MTRDAGVDQETVNEDMDPKTRLNLLTHASAATRRRGGSAARGLNPAEAAGEGAT